MNIRNPEKWIGKYIGHMDNANEFRWERFDEFAVCEWTGKLIRREDANPFQLFSDAENTLISSHPRFEFAYDYSEEGLQAMLADTANHHKVQWLCAPVEWAA